MAIANKKRIKNLMDLLKGRMPKSSYINVTQEDADINLGESMSNIDSQSVAKKNYMNINEGQSSYLDEPMSTQVGTNVGRVKNLAGYKNVHQSISGSSKVTSRH